MSMRTLADLRQEFNRASSIHDIVGLEGCAVELDEIGTLEARALAENARGAIDRLHGRFSQALERFQRVLAMYEELGDRNGMAVASGNLGLVHASSGDYPQTLELFRSAIALYDEIGDQQGKAAVITNIGNVYNLTCDHKRAIEQFQIALSLYNALGNRIGAANVNIGVGNAWYNIGQYNEAFEHWQQALSLFEELGDIGGAASVIGNMGRAYVSLGDYPRALEHVHRALAVFEHHGIRASVANETVAIGNIYRNTGNYPEALEHYHRALALNEEIGDKSGVAYVTGAIGNVYAATGAYPIALEHYQRARALHEELGERSSVAGLINSIGNAHGNAGDYALALECFRQALPLYEELGERRGIATVSCSTVEALIALGSFDEAQPLLALMDEMQIDEPETSIHVELCRASIQEYLGATDDAINTLAAALASAREHTLPAVVADIHKRLRDLCQLRNDFPGYIEHNNEYTSITQEINGKDTATKLAVQEAERKIAKERSEHEMHLAVLHSTLPKHVAERVVRGEKVNDSFENAAILFLDVVGFTTYSGELDASEVVALLDSIFTSFDGICAQYDVMKIKTIGDSYMAVAFGAENSEQRTANQIANSEQRIANVAVEMMAAEFVWPNTGERVRFRIGLHSGPVVAGVLGLERMQYDVWGDAVNLASRMESTGEPGKIHISGALAKALMEAHDMGRSHAVTILPRGVIEVKGKGEMQTFWLEG